MNVDPQIHSIALQRRVKLSDEPPIELTFFIKATCVKGLTAGEDDSDRYSVSSMSRDTIGSESQSDAAALQSDQDLDVRLRLYKDRPLHLVRREQQQSF